MSNTPINRWLILLSGVLINLCIGSAYAWSVFQKPLISIFKWSTSEASLAFTLSLSIVPLAMIVAGKIQDQKGPKLVIFAGGIIFSLGIIGAGFTDNLTFLYATSVYWAVSALVPFTPVQLLTPLSSFPTNAVWLQDLS